MLESGTSQQHAANGGRSRSVTRERILDCADKLMLSRGFNGFAYQHIATELGIRNAAVHYHFPSKEDLGVALVRRYRSNFDDWVDQLPEESDAFDRLNGLIENYRQYATAEHSLMCPCGTLAAEYTTLPEAMRVQSRLLMRDVHQWLAKILEQGRCTGRFDFGGDALDQAVQVSAALQGALQIARVEGVRRFQQVADQITRSLLPMANTTLQMMHG